VRLFVGAVAQEFTGLLKRCTHLRRERLPVHWAHSGLFQGKPMLAIANGAGPKRAFAAVAGPDLEMVINIGFCGALDPTMEIAQVFVATHVNGQAIDTPRSPLPAATGSLISIDHIARNAEEKQSLRARGAAAVEMEAAGALKRAQSLGIPFYSIRAVSDLAKESFHCDFNLVLRDDGRFDVSRLALQAGLHPFTCLPELLRLNQRAKLASERLGEFLASCEF
jgi:adenosylhomocysteine nucleosidase